MASRAKAFTAKRAKAAEDAINRELDTGGDKIDFEGLLKQDTKDAAMGKGEEELFEKKLSKEEKKALAKAKREAKKKEKGGKKGKGGDEDGGDDDDADEEKKDDAPSLSKVLSKVSLNNNNNNPDIDPNSDEAKHEAALEELSRQNIVVTYTQRKGNLHANTRDIKVQGVNVAFHGKHLIEETEIVINYGNRYGFIGPNGSGKVSLSLCFISHLRMTNVSFTNSNSFHLSSQQL
jgi:ABC-type glutathione transport system ATPase component